MNNSQDTDVIDATRASGHDISEASRTAIRANLRAAISGEQVAPVVGLHATPRSQHRTNRRRVVVTGLVAAAASIAAVAVVVDRDNSKTITPATVDTNDVAVTVEPSPTDPSPTEPEPTAPQPTVDTAVPDTVGAVPGPDQPVTADQLTGHTWFVVGQAFADSTEALPEAWPDAILPTVAFGDGGALATGFDGCNSYSLQGTIADSSLVVTEFGSTTALCEGLQPARIGDGDQLSLSPDGSTLMVARAGSDSGLVLVAGDRLTSPDTIDGPVIFDDTVSLKVDFIGANNTLSLGMCGFQFAVTNGVLTVQSELTPEQTLATCINGLTLDAAEQRFYDAITSLEPLRLVNDPISGQLIMIWNDSALRLTLLGQDVGTGIVPEWASVAGVRTGQVITAEAALAQLETVLGPVDHDTDWYTTPVVTFDDGTEDCLGGKDYRVLWWGDFSLALWRINGVESIWAWSVGDIRSSSWGDRRESYSPADPSPAALATDNGIHVGSTEAEFQAAYPNAIANDPTTAEPDGTVTYTFPFNDGTPFGQYRLNRSLGLSVTVLDGVVTGIGSARQFC